MTLFQKLRALFGRKKLDADMAEEMRGHLERRTQANLAAGMSPDEARYAAQRQFGGVEQLREIAREQRTFTWIEQLRQDVRYGLRQMRKHPGFASIVMLILAIGIGANTAVFSTLDILLLRPLPVPAPEQLALVQITRLQGPAGGAPSNFVSPAIYERLDGHLQSFTGLVALHGSSGRRSLVPSGFGRSETIRGRASDVSGNYFSVLQVRPFLGRLLLPEDDRSDAPRAVVVLSHGFWETAFGGDRAVVGKSVLIENVSFEIVGVAPPGFSGVKTGEPVEMWTPLQMLPIVNPRIGGNLRAGGWGNGFLVLGRLRPGISFGQAEAELDVVSQQEMAALRPDVAPADRQRVLGKMGLTPGAGGFGSDVRRKAGPLLSILLTVVVLVQIIACANVASLSLARLASRQRELAARTALGAGRGRIVRQLLTESLLLVSGGALAGLLLVYWGLVAARAQGLDASANGMILLFVLAISVVTGVIVAVVPALRSSRIDLVSALKNQGGGLGGGSGQGLLRAMVVIQLSVSGCLVAGTGYLVRTVQNLQEVDLGFRVENLLLVRVSLPGDYDPIRRGGLAQELLRATAELPGVSHATFSTGGLLGGGISQGPMEVSGYLPRPGEDLTGHYVFIGPDFFEAVGLPLVRGRALAWADVFAEPRPLVQKTVINEAVARRFFAGADPIGRHFNWGPGEYEIVGVAKNTKYRDLREESALVCYVPDGRINSSTIAMQIRATGNPRALAASMAALVNRLDPNARVQTPETIADVMAQATQEERMIATGVGAFSALALLLTALGLYGLLAYNVAQRTREIGVRMALGGRAGDIVALIVKQGVKLVLVGWLVGVVAAVALVRVIASRLYGVSAVDPFTVLGTGCLLGAVALLACWLPARRAAKVDPMVALRCE